MYPQCAHGPFTFPFRSQSFIRCIGSQAPRGGACCRWPGGARGVFSAVCGGAGGGCFALAGLVTADGVAGGSGSGLAAAGGRLFLLGRDRGAVESGGAVYRLEGQTRRQASGTPLTVVKRTGRLGCPVAQIGQFARFLQADGGRIHRFDRMALLGACRICSRVRQSAGPRNSGLMSFSRGFLQGGNADFAPWLAFSGRLVN